MNAHALTHAHPDHQGASDEVCGKLRIPFWVGAGDVELAERPQAIAESQGPHPLNRLAMRYWVGSAATSTACCAKATTWRVSA